MTNNQETSIKNGLVLPYATKDTPLVTNLTPPAKVGNVGVWEACNLPPETLQKVLTVFKTQSGSKRFFKYLATTQDPNDRITVKCNMACSVGNLSDTAAKINDRIYQFGLQISCDQPRKYLLKKPVNKFGEETQQYVWSLYRLKQAANDDNAQQGVK